jgi:ubiquinone/menaquinone biosynthesis C-methylase UbiE
MNALKQEVKKFWNDASCGESLYLAGQNKMHYETQSTTRYELEPYILGFADFSHWAGKTVLEIGVGLGADHQKFAEAGADLYGIDLTERAVKHTSARLDLFNLPSQIAVGDAEQLQFPDNHFDLVYSWGVIHHSPNTRKAAQEIIRVLKPGGEFRVMVYNKYSMIGFMLWLRYALAAGRPWRSLQDIYASHLESPGTKAYSKAEAEQLFSGTAHITIETVLTHGDLLEGKAGQRHRGIILSLARFLWPRWLIKMLFPRSGLFMLIRGRKSS